MLFLNFQIVNKLTDATLNFKWLTNLKSLGMLSQSDGRGFTPQIVVRTEVALPFSDVEKDMALENLPIGESAISL